MASQLALYNEALTDFLGERELASLSENREPRRVLDNIWTNAVAHCLEEGQWKFALRTSELTYNNSIEPSFGFTRAFDKPTDLVRLVALGTDEFLHYPLLRYTEEAGYWYADHDTLYISYVSDDASYGGDLGNWPESFTRYVAAYLAYRACNRVKQSGTDKEVIGKEMLRLLKDARSKDAMSGPTKFMPQGRWVTARTSGTAGDRGNRNSLYG